MTTQMYEVLNLKLERVLIKRKVEALNHAFEKQNAEIEDRAIVSKGPLFVCLTLISLPSRRSRNKGQCSEATLVTQC